MIRLYLSDNLCKSTGSPPTGGGPKGVSMPKTPGAAVGGSGPQTVDCPLGAACPDGGKHQMGSGKLKDHTERAQQAGKTGQTPGDESTGQPTDKPGVPPSAANIGGVGSDQVSSAQKVRKVNQVAGPLKNRPGDQRLQGRDYYVDQWQNWPYANSTRPSLEEHLKRNGFRAKDIQEAHQEEGIDQFEARKPTPVGTKGGADKTQIDIPGQFVNRAKSEHDKTQEMSAAPEGMPPESDSKKTQEVGYQTYGAELGDEGHKQFATGKSPIVGHDENAPDTAQTLREFPASAEEDTPNESEISQRKTLIDPVFNADPDKKRQKVPNPMVADESSVPVDSKPMDHYKLSQVARESGDEELAKFHEGMARKRTDGMGSEDHKKLSEQLHAEGMHDAANYHSGIHQRVQEDSGNKASVPMMITKDQHQQLADLGHSKEARNSMKPEEAHEILSEKKHESTMRDAHSEARTKATSDLEAAKKQHESTKAAADKIRSANEEKLKGYEAAKKQHESAKAEGKKVKPPKKPELEKEPKVPERPELSEPASDGDKLRHETHTSKAKRLADMAESHLKGNQNLSSGDRKRLEHAHKMATYHSNIGYTPTSAHKKELGDVEQAISGMGIKANHEEVAAAENAKKTAEASKQAEKDKAAADKQKASSEKQQAKQEKEQQKLKPVAPKPPQTDLDHARVADHQSRAKKLRGNIESHMAENAGMSPEDKTKHERILAELDKHENMDMLPTTDHQSELKELEKLAGAHGKKAYEPDSPDDSGGDSGPSAMGMLRAGNSMAAQSAGAITSWNGRAGAIPGQLVSYGVSGAASSGHRLLKDKKEEAPAGAESGSKASLDADKESRAKQAPKPEEGSAP